MNNNEKLGAVIYGSGIGSLTKPSHKLGTGILFQDLKSRQIARDLGHTRVIKQFATVGYNITEDERTDIVENREPIWSRLTENSSKLKIYNKDGSDYGQIRVDIFPSTEHSEYQYFNQILKETDYRARAFDHLPEFAQSRDYSVLQTAQFLNFLNIYGNLTKVGWSFDKKHPDLDQQGLANLIKKGVRSEYYFDQLLKVLFPDQGQNLQTVLVPGIRNPRTGNQHVGYNINGDTDLPNVEQRYSDYCSQVADAEFFNQTIKQADKQIVKVYQDIAGQIDSYQDDYYQQVISKVDTIQENIFGGIEA